MLISDSERIKKVLDHANMSASRFAKHIGLKTPQNIYDIQRGKHGISKLVAEKITAKYLNINRIWLLTGEGEMFNEVLPPIEANRLIEIGAEVFEKKLNELFQEGLIYSAKVVAEKDEKINELYRELGKLQAIISELQKANARPDDNVSSADANRHSLTG